MGKRAFIVTQSIKKLPTEDREWALEKTGFRRISNHKPVDISQLSEEDTRELFYKDAPYTTKKLHQRLIITYSPKYALYQKTIRNTQIERAKKMLASGSKKKNRHNPNDPARFIGKTAATEEGEAAKISYYLDTDKIAEEEKYDGLYAVCTDLLEDSPADILRVSEGRWQIEACFRVLKTDFSARPVFVQREDRIQAHFLTCFAVGHYDYVLKGGVFAVEPYGHSIGEDCGLLRETDIGESGFAYVVGYGDGESSVEVCGDTVSAADGHYGGSDEGFAGGSVLYGAAIGRVLCGCGPSADHQGREKQHQFSHCF